MSILLLNPTFFVLALFVTISVCVAVAVAIHDALAWLLRRCS